MIKINIKYIRQNKVINSLIYQEDSFQIFIENNLKLTQPITLYNKYCSDLMSHSSKSTILSKAEKMKVKRDSKKDQEPPIIEILDSDSSQQHVRVPANIPEKKPHEEKHQNFKTSQQQNKQQGNTIIEQPSDRTYANMINFQRIKKFQSVVLPQRAPIILKTEICGDGMEISNYEGRHLIGYKIAGTQSTKYISQNHLRQRTTNASEDLQRQQQERKEKEMKLLESQQQNKEKIIMESLRQMFNDEEEVQKQGKKADEEANKRKNGNKIYRYFDLDKSSESDEGENEQEQDDISRKKAQKCFRCGEKGHIAKNCHIQAKTTCMFCLGDHHHTECTDKLCYRCNQTGHVSQQCKANGKKCNRCRKVGHIEKDCGTIMMLDYSSMRDGEIRERYSESDLKRLKCLAECRNRKGHFNCFQYGSRPQKIYGNSQKESYCRY